jgi:DNA-binding response OmpR family regulator
MTPTLHKTVMIVDDEPNVRLMFRTALETAGYTLVTADDGETALTWLAQSPADLVLLDLQMPVIDGMEVLKRLRDRGQDVPVVIVTAHGSVPNAVAAMRLGAIDFVSKPLTPDALRRVVAEVLARHELIRTKAGAVPPPRAPVTAASEFAANMTRAKRALNRRELTEAEVYLKQAIALSPESAEAHNLMGVLHECRNEHDASYREYRAALKADRHHEPARHNITRYYERFSFGRSDVPIDTGS